MPYPIFRIFLVVLLLASFYGPGLAEAHKTSLSKSAVIWESARPSWKIHVSAHDLAVALGIETDLITPLPSALFQAKKMPLEAYFLKHLALEDGRGTPCKNTDTTFKLSSLPEEVVVLMTFSCSESTEDAPQSLMLKSTLFLEIDNTHRMLGQLKAFGRQEDFILAQDTPEFWAEAGSRTSAPLTRFWAMVTLGVEHILMGFDHLLFLFALLLGAIGWVTLLKMITAFTLAHSITLGLAWGGVLDLPGPLVEVAIAFSVVYVAAENIFRKNLQHRWALTFLFGLIHGLGFYGVLRDLSMEGTSLVATLVGFNLGVELGQLAAVALVFPLLQLAAKYPWYGRSRAIASILILCMGGLWMGERILVL